MISLKKAFAAVALAVGLMIPTQLLAQDSGPDLDPQEATQNLTQEDMRRINSLSGLFNFVSQNHYKEPSVQELMEEAIECAPHTVSEWEIFNCVLQKLDPHSRYMDPAQAEAFWERVQGQFGGVGVTIRYDAVKDGFEVMGFSDNSPSEAAGLQEGDVITHIDGHDVSEDGRSSISMLRGDIGTDVVLTVKRTGQTAPVEITVTRAAIERNPVISKQIGDNIGYVRLTDFGGDNSQERLREAIEEHIANMGDDFDGIVLDLRGNPGGLLSEAIDIVDDFINDGIIVSEGPDAQHPDRVHNATDGDILNGKRLVVLVDEGSASASEVVTGALQDHDRAVVIGTQSYGKGSVQSIYNLTNGGALRLTTYLYFLPTGRSIQGEGITPDIEHVDDNAAARPHRREADNAGMIANPNAVQDSRPSQICEGHDDLDASTLDQALLDGRGNPDEPLICAVEYLNWTSDYMQRAPVNDNDDTEDQVVPEQPVRGRQP